jgi:membrane protease YdiL (CAAX protease family)
MTKKQIQINITTILIFIIAVFSRDLVFSIKGYADLYRQLPEIIRWLEQPVRWFLLCWLGLFLMHRCNFVTALKELGLVSEIGRGLLFAFLACLPMLLGPLVFGKISRDISILSLLFYAGIWPLAEEILYRGYTFGQLHSRGGLGFWWAAILSGFIFGLVHLGQASVKKLPLEGEIGTVLIISIGGILYAWLFFKWQNNLWVPFGMHMFMNLWWNVFDMADSPLGGWGPNLMRLLTVILAIALTLFRDRIPLLKETSKLGT